MSVNAKAVLGENALASVWAMKHRRLDGRRLKFYSKRDPWAHRPFQVAPLDDWSQTIVVKKGRQMGLTELFLIKTIHLACTLRCMTVYTLPKDRKAEEIAKTRIDPLGQPKSPSCFDESITEKFVGWRNLMFKQIAPKVGGGVSSIIITGSWNEDQLRSPC